MPSDRASFIPLVLLIRPRCASAVLSHSSFYPTYSRSAGKGKGRADPESSMEESDDEDMEGEGEGSGGGDD